MNDVIVSLSGVIVGGLIGFFSGWGLQQLKKAAIDKALREQVLSIMSMLEGRMIAMINHDKWYGGGGWDVARLLTERVFSTEGTTALAGRKVGEFNFFVAATEIQRLISRVDETTEKLRQFQLAVQDGDFHSTGEARYKALLQELRTYAQPTRNLLRDSRAALGDHSQVQDPLSTAPGLEGGQPASGGA
jgi:hypothetical protein